MKKVIFLPFLLLAFLSCSKSTVKVPDLLDAGNFDSVLDDKHIALYTLESGNGLYMQVTNYGGRVVSLYVPDREGKYEDIVLGYENINRYLYNNSERFLGPVVGRYANRIARGQFELDGVTYHLPINNNGQTLHGGLKGLDGVVWSVEKLSKNEITFSYFSPDGEEGFPGTVEYEMTYTLTPDNAFKLTYQAVTDKPTVVNLSHHGLFNLKGEGNGTVLDHELTIYAEEITPVDEYLIPTGEYRAVGGTPFDFRTPHAIGAFINDDDQQLKYGGGYDHNWVVSRTAPDTLQHMATLYEPVSGRVMEVWSDQPGLQFYSGNFFNGTVTGKRGKTLKHREAVALETQKFPDSPNHSNFPSTRLDPGETYRHTCVYKFGVR